MSLLQKTNYVLTIREPEFDEHCMFKGLNNDIHLHVFSIGSKEIERYLIFRNYLRQNREARKIYVNIKRQLAKKKWKYIQNYADVKSEVINKIMEEAIK